MRSLFLVPVVDYVLAGLVVVHVAMRQKRMSDENRNVNTTEHVAEAVHRLINTENNASDIPLQQTRLVCHVICGSWR
jgi:hypothetical protein